MCPASLAFTCWAIREAPKALLSVYLSHLFPFWFCNLSTEFSRQQYRSEWVTIPFSRGWRRLGVPSVHWAPKFPLQWVSLIFFAVCFSFAVFCWCSVKTFYNCTRKSRSLRSFLIQIFLPLSSYFASSHSAISFRHHFLLRHKSHPVKSNFVSLRVFYFVFWEPH